MELNANLPENFNQLPNFQKMQYLFAAHVRDPESVPYEADEKVEGANPIETRRLKAYEELFFNNLHGFFSNLFPVLSSIVGASRWSQIVREYMQKHRARTPLFHELGQEFLLFLQNEFEPQVSDPEFIYELAHYEWVELSLTVEQKDQPTSTNNKEIYRLSKTAMPLYYQWPVDQISQENIPDKPPEQPTFILAYRSPEYVVEFMQISASLYLMLNLLEDNQTSTLTQIVSEISQMTGQEPEVISAFANQTLAEFAEKGIVV